MKPAPRALVLSSVAVILVGCSQQPPFVPPPDDPVIQSVDPEFGLPGTVVNVTGSDLGEPGTLVLGGVAIEPVSWTDEAVVFTVPDGVPPAWQTLALAPAEGGAAEAQFFVGVGFEGEPEELVGFVAGLEPGTHVLLPSGELSLPGEELVVDRVHLHGREDGTSLELGLGGIAFVTDGGGAASLMDLEVDGAYVAFRGPGLDDIVAQQVGLTSVLLEGFEYFGASFGQDPVGGSTGASQLTVVDSTLVVTGSALFVGFPDVAVVGSSVTAHGVSVHAEPGEARIEASTLAGHAEVDVFAIERATVTGSTLVAEDGNVSVVARGSSVVEPPILGSVLVEGSVLEARETPENGISDEESGQVAISASGGTVEVMANERIAAVDRVEISAGAEGGATVRLADNLDIAAGRFLFPSLVSPDTGVFVSANGLGLNDLEVTNNLVRSDATVHLLIGEALADVTIKGNRVEAGLGRAVGTVVISVGQGGAVDVSDNEFLASSKVEVSDEVPTQSAKTVTFAGNAVTVEGAPSPMFLFMPTASSCSFTDNVVAVDASNVPSFSANLFDCNGNPGTGTPQFELLRNELVIQGPESYIVVGGFSGEEGPATTVLENRLTASRQIALLAHFGTIEVVGNEFVTAEVRLGESTVETTFTDNVVTYDGSVDRMLVVTGAGLRTITGNEFTQVGTPAEAATGAYFEVAAGVMELDVTGNTFTNLSRALAFLLDAGQMVGGINDTVFDFPIEERPEAGDFILRNGSILNLDMTLNYWGGVTDQSDLIGMMEFDLSGGSGLNFTLLPFKTD